MNKIKNVAIRLVHAIFIFVPVLSLVYGGMYGDWNTHLLKKNIREKQKFLYLPLWGCIVGVFTVMLLFFAITFLQEDQIAVKYLILLGVLWLSFLIGLAYWVAPLTWSVCRYHTKISRFITKQGMSESKKINTFLVGCLRAEYSTINLAEDDFLHDCFEYAVHHLTQCKLLTSPRSEIFEGNS